jgi:hypothetical protein
LQSKNIAEVSILIMNVFFYFLVIQEKKVILKMCLKMVVIQKNFVLNLDQNLMVGKKSENHLPLSD